ncbi:MAG: hypothetical protein Fur0041_08390 [Bacteroidia bacterium]
MVNLQNTNAEINVRSIYLFIVAAILVYIPALYVDVMDVDAAQYASLSREMLETGNWFEVHHRGNDYLDKPPLLFWLSAMSFKILGYSNFAYKLPSFLFALLGIFATGKLAELLYDKVTGAIAALMAATGLGVFIMCNDIRTDTMLFGSISLALWQILLFVKTKNWSHLFLGFAAIGLAMLSKGPLGLVMPAMALVCEFAYKRQWVNFFRWQWLVGLSIVALMLIPMCYGLYHQFDLHPEKTVNGHTGVSGLRFYFWTQSFGRITGESDWGTKYDNGAGPFFFTHTFLWVFFPWSLFVAGGLIKNLIILVKTRFRAGYLNEMLSIGGFIMIFLALSSSRYKLPHYIYVLFPLASVIGARFFIHDVIRGSRAWLRNSVHILFVVIYVALMILTLLILFFIFPGADLIIIITGLFWFVAGIIMFLKLKTYPTRYLFLLLSGLLGAYYTANTHFYPNLLNYQSDTVAGKMAANENVPKGALLMYGDVFEHSIDFYSGNRIEGLYPDSAQLMQYISKYNSVWYYTDTEGKALIEKSGLKVVSVKELDHFSVQFLTTRFLNPATRSETLRKRYFIRISA